MNCDENDTSMNILKKITMKDAMFWSADAWQALATLLIT